MIIEIVKQWEENKGKLEEYFRTTNQKEYSDYADLLKRIFEQVLTDDEDEWDLDKMVVIDHGDYQGTQLFITPKKTYQPGPSDYIITHNGYGSCSGCDTLESIQCMDGYGDDLPNEKQIKEYMILALHLIQKMSTLKDE